MPADLENTVHTSFSTLPSRRSLYPLFSQHCEYHPQTRAAPFHIARMALTLPDDQPSRILQAIRHAILVDASTMGGPHLMNLLHSFSVERVGYSALATLTLHISSSSCLPESPENGPITLLTHLSCRAAQGMVSVSSTPSSSDVRSEHMQTRRCYHHGQEQPRHPVAC